MRRNGSRRTLLVALVLGLASVGATPARADLLARYMCQIGSEDLYNSSGQRLHQVREVLRQDRANYHSLGIRHRRDLRDENYFASKAHRSLFDRLPLDCPGWLKGRILAGDVTLGVRVYSDRIIVRIPDMSGDY